MTTIPREFNWRDEQGQTIYAVEWPPSGEARAVLGLVHGLGEHCRRYDHYLAWFAEQGVACVSYDRQGHGRSDGKRGYARDYKLYVDEIARLVRECGTRYPGRPIFLYGHSMGGQLTLRYLVRRNPRIAGVIISAPHIRLPTAPNPLKVRIGRWLRRWKPDLALGNGLDKQFLSRDADVVVRYEADSLVHDRLSARTGIDMLENAALLNRFAGKVEVPLLIMHGQDDRITSANGSRDFVERVSGPVTYQEWPGLYHELHNEPEWTTVAEFVLGWIEERL